MKVDYIRSVEGTYTAQAFITTDLDDNQITAFHPGAMQYAHLNKVSDATVRPPIICAGNCRAGRAAGHDRACRAIPGRGIPFIFDPGQGMPMFGADELEDSSSRRPAGSRSTTTNGA